MKSYPEIYASYVKYHHSITDTPPLAFEQWMNLPPLHDEVKRHEADVFLASLHPDGGNLAGFHGVKGDGDYVATKTDKA